MNHFLCYFEFNFLNMRSFICFDLGETLINFNLKNRWYKSLKNEVIPLMWARLKQLTTSKPENIEFTRFQNVLYKSIAREFTIEKNTSFIDRIKIGLSRLNIDYNEEIKENLLDSFYKIIREKSTLFPEVQEILNYLNRRKYTIGLFSDTPWQSPGYLMDRLLKHHEIYSLIDFRLYSGDIKIRKPNPRTLLILSEKAKKRSEDMVYIGDKDVDIEVAFRCKIPSILVNRHKDKRVKLSRKPTYEIDSLLHLKEIISKL
ncbi:MAG: HAD hydrolase-like protein [Candidatus Lokiarchaeota archaeon]|nr:HAD hydrolase-like protein [Candidatus Lokiarchaeota archaeon]